MGAFNRISGGASDNFLLDPAPSLFWFSVLSSGIKCTSSDSISSLQGLLFISNLRGVDNKTDGTFETQY